MPFWQWQFYIHHFVAPLNEDAFSRAEICPGFCSSRIPETSCPHCVSLTTKSSPSSLLTADCRIRTNATDKLINCNKTFKKIDKLHNCDNQHEAIVNESKITKFKQENHCKKYSNRKQHIAHLSRKGCSFICCSDSS